MDNIELTAVFPIEKSRDVIMSSLEAGGGILESIKWKKTTYTVQANFSIDLPTLEKDIGRVENKLAEIGNNVQSLGGKVKRLMFEVKME